MGLDTSHDCWHGAYSAFNRWRNHLAELAGYAIRRVEQDTPMPPMNTVMIDWGHLPPNALEGEWPTLPDDPLLILIAHSDCDGIIKAEHTGPLADRLDELLPLLADMPPDGGHIGDWSEKTRQFIDGLRTAAKAGEDVEFG